MSSRLLLFPMVFSLVYVLVYGLQITVVLYYPKVGGLFIRPQPPFSGPGMLYYGWVAAALIAAAIVCFVVPRRWAERVPRTLSWLSPIAAMAYVIFHERGWLLP